MTASKTLSPTDIKTLDQAWQAARSHYQKERLHLLLIMFVLFPITVFLDATALKAMGFPGIATTGLLILIPCFVFLKRCSCEAKLKPDIISALLPQFGAMTYHQHAGIHPVELERYKIIPAYDKFHAEDFFEGRYKGTDFCFCEMRLLQKFDDSYIPVFVGLVVLISYEKKKFDSHTILVADSPANAAFMKVKAPDMRRADMVDPEFEKLYDVYTTDQVEARYLIDHLMIEPLKKLNNMCNRGKVSVAFLDQEVLLMIPTWRPMFEPTSIKLKTLNREVFIKLRNEILQVLSIIDVMNLYKRTSPS